MNIFESVYDHNCPNCGRNLSQDLKAIANSTEYGRQESADLLCYCGAMLKVKFEWGVIWSEVTASAAKRAEVAA